MTGKKIFFEKVAILGVGLIGGSLALSLKQRGLCGTIVGFGRREESLYRAKELNLIDEYSLDAAHACTDADLIVFAVPVGLFKELALKATTGFKRGAIVTDVGSVKGMLVFEMESLMPQEVFYVGSHPITGSENSGIEDARADMFEGAHCILTPTESTDRSSLFTVADLWKTVGCRTEEIDPSRHDEIYAAVSHFPHILAYALVNSVDRIDSNFIQYAGQGFKDTTRIAMSSPEMWRDISLLNRENLLKLSKLFRERLDLFDKLLKSGDAVGLEKEFRSARESRTRLK
ncbi:MAG: prephenate dehydrogenase/arogenate dehydrogenase family protein [Nitrospirae bacterium]|nr:prephenate dehydrogenase/arogenate dehydrogenase family protein [Nitrospirota bacterium]